MNKTFTLSSVGQNPENFSCNLFKTEFIPPNHQIALLNLNMDTHTGTNHHYQIPEIGYKLHDMIIGGGARLHRQLDPPILMANGEYADMVQVSNNDNSIIFFYFKTNNGVATITNPGTRYHPNTKLPMANFTFQNNFIIPPVANIDLNNTTWSMHLGNISIQSYTLNGFDYVANLLFNGGTRYIKMTGLDTFDFYIGVGYSNPQQSCTISLENSNILFEDGAIWSLTSSINTTSGIAEQTSGLLGPFGENNTPLLGTANQLVIHTPYGNSSTWTNHQIQTILGHSTGYIEKIFVPNNQLPRAEFIVSLDNLPIENHISNNSFQGIVPAVYTHHNRFDSEADESIVPHHLIYHKLNNKGHLRIGKIVVSIRDNITNDILHPTTFSNPTNLTLHIKPI